MKALTRKELLASPGCGHDEPVMYLHARCHPASKLDVFYEKRCNEIAVICGTCQRLITRVLVAEDHERIGTH